MTTKIYATLTSKGQITIPARLREQWKLKAGDKIAFEKVTEVKGTIRPERRRSIFDLMDEWQLPPISKPLSQKDIDDAIRAAMAERQARLTSKGKA